MPSQKGKTAPLGKLRDDIYYHQFLGGYSQEMLNGCATIEIESIQKIDHYLLKVKVKNRSVGHGLPAASPLRMVILSIEAFDDADKSIWKNFNVNPISEDQQAVFMKLLEDSNGTAPALPWKASGERFDTRLMPQEERILQYNIPALNIKTIQASLNYYVAPPPLLRELYITDPNFTSIKTIYKLRQHIN